MVWTSETPSIRASNSPRQKGPRAKPVGVNAPSSQGWCMHTAVANQLQKGKHACMHVRIRIWRWNYLAVFVPAVRCRVFTRATPRIRNARNGSLSNRRVSHNRRANIILLNSCTRTNTQLCRRIGSKEEVNCPAKTASYAKEFGRDYHLLA